MTLNLLPQEKIVSLLRAGPDSIAAAVEGRNDEWLVQRPGPDAWSPNEILAHLRACQDVWGDIRVIRMLKEDHPTMRAVNPRTWAQQTDYSELSFLSSLAVFVAQRERFVAVLDDLTEIQWSRSATLTGGGKPRRYTVHTETDALARHERSHIKQIELLCNLP